MPARLPSDLRLCEATLTTQHVPYRMPIKFGGRVMTEVLLVDVAVEAETRDGRRGRGFGSMPLASVWAWPGALRGRRRRKTPCSRWPRNWSAKPTTIANRAIRWRSRAAWPPLMRKRRRAAARRVAGTDPAAGTTGGRQPLGSGDPRRLRQDPAAATASTCWGRSGSTPTLRPIWTSGLPANISTATRSQPRPTMPLYHLVGALDPLSDADLVGRIGDGLPETLAQWIAADGLTHLKIKLNGDDLDWDVERVLSVERVAAAAQAARGCADWRYSADFNEKCGSVEYVIDFLAQLARVPPRRCDGCSTSSSPCRET